MLIAAQGYQESGLDHSKRSQVGAIGIMQVMPATARDARVAIRDIDKLDRNIEAGMKYLRAVIDEYYADEPMSKMDKMLFALASALRLARFNTLIDDERPKWQSDFFMGVPTPAAAILVLLPIYLEHIGLDLRASPILLNLVLVYVMLIGLMMVSILPTYSGKLLGERIEREWVLPLFILSMLAVACLLTYPYPTLAIASIGGRPKPS